MKVQTKVEEYYMHIHIKCGLNEKVLLDELDLFAPKGLVGFFKVKEKDKKRVSYSGIKAISLKERLEKPISKFEFFFILEQFLISIQKAEESDVSLNNIVYEIDKVFITETTNELQLIYLPLSSKNSSKSPTDFMEAFIYSALSVQENKYISDFALYLRKQMGFNVKNIESYIKQIEPKVIKILKDDELIMVDDEHIIPVREEKSTVLGDSRGISLEEEKGTVLGNNREMFNDQEDGTVLADDNETVIGNGEDEECTMLIGYEQTRNITPYLIQKSTNDIIKINQSFFRFGSKEGVVDYRIQNNNTVSRMHADIIIKKQKCFVVDLNSKNKTYVNNCSIPPKVEVEIFDGDIIRFANEEFEFCM